MSKKQHRATADQIRIKAIKDIISKLPPMGRYEQKIIDDEIAKLERK